MSVITVSRGSFSGGRALAECLATHLGYRCVGREAIVERAAASGVSHQELLDALLKPPSFLDRFKHKRYQYLTLFQAALAEEVKSGKVVYHGNAGHLLLKGARPVLRVRIIAPLEKRLAMLEERLKLRGSAARDYIEKVDEERRKWTRYLYGVSWEDPALYDVVYNLEFFEIEEVCKSVTNIIQGAKSFQFSAECQADLENLAIASRVRANVALNPLTSHLEIEATAKNGHVKIKGKGCTPEEREEVERLALAVPGVATVNVDELIPAAQV
ncbi:MAG TPA: cytidylate kinase family protein [Terriglobia bacterium]|nr:cytidylate kinase family protein [Terriglobia bacterium]